MRQSIQFIRCRGQTETYFDEMGHYDGETLHGFRAGCAITLALSGVELSEVMDNVGWTQRHTALYYLQLAKVLNPGGASDVRLAHVDLAGVTKDWANVNELRQFVSAFPSALYVQYIVGFWQIWG
jgi:hypothetical protein